MEGTDTALRRLAEARSRHADDRIRAALRELRAAGGATSVARVARIARVSRQTIYNRPEVLAEVKQLRSAGTRTPPIQRASESSTAARLELALTDNRRLRTELRAAQAEIARLLGAQRMQANRTPRA